MENIRPIKKKFIVSLVLGGALIGGALFISANFARSYDQQNTHPALTDESVDLYNLSFPNNRLTEDDKKWLIKGAIDEDTAPRPVNHFYDPIYNQGWLSYTSSKIWAYSSERQIAFLGGKSQTAGFAQFFIGDELSADDYSYQRALYDYAVGNRKRAMLAIGHIMHLLEDANVPDHTRNDTHLPWAGTESPYEQEMVKWNPVNLDIAGKIFASGVKPVLLNRLGDYFDKIAKYSNNYFFSEDTILSKKYPGPRELFERKISDQGVEFIFAMGRDKNGDIFPLYKKGRESSWRNLVTETSFTIKSDLVLDNYWSRLSKDFVPLGAGALRLFLEQAELVKSEYAKNQQVVQEPGLWERLLGLLGFSGQNEPQLVFNPGVIDSILAQPVVSENDVGVPPTSLTPFATPSLFPTPSLTPSATPSTPLIPSPTSSPTSSPSPSSSPLPSLTPTPLPGIKYIQVMKVQDGDTIQLIDGNFVRLIGINAPEKDEFYYQQSLEKLSELVLNKVVRLEKDVSERDIYGRLLRNVFFLDNIFINLEMVRGGYARVLTIPPDTKYAAELKAAETEAKSKKLGIWSQYEESRNKDNEDEEGVNEQVKGVSAATVGRVVINEIAWAGTVASALDEWVELYNTENYDINLAGWTLKSADNSPNIVLDGVIEAGGYFLIERTDDDTITTKKADVVTSFGSGGLNNEGEILTLSDAGGKIVDIAGRLGEKWFAGEAGQRVSMERINVLAAGDNISNWHNFQTSFATFDADAKGNKINGTPRAQNSSIVVASSGGGGGSGGGSPSSTPSLTPLPSPSPSPTPTSSPSPTPSPSPSPTPTPEPISLGTKVVINEIAWMGTATSSYDEWLELYNITSKSVDLGGWRLKSLTDGSPNIVLASKSIGPFGFFLLERTDDNPISNISADWWGSFGQGGLNNDGEVLELRDKDDNLQDLAGSVASGSVLAWYGRGDKETRSSMERIDPTRVGDNSANWATNDGVTVNGHDAAGNPINGTPRARNSVCISQKPSTITDLAVDPTSYFGQIKLTWSAPKDDDSPKNDLKYDLRYATRSFDAAADWESAAKVASSSMPNQVADYGQPQSSSFTIFDYNQKYYFAIKTTDGSSWSEISNQPPVYTIKPAISDVLTTFRGPTRPTISWEFFQIPDGGYPGQPVVSKDGTIYFGASTLETPTLGKVRLYAINPSGTEKWRFEEEHMGIPTTPAISDDGAVYFGHLSSWVTALNPNGTPRWQFDTTRVNSVSVDEDGNVCATSDNKMINKIGPDGEKIWQVYDPYAFSSTPVAIPGDKDTYLGIDWTGLPGFYRLNGGDGTVVWQSRVSDSYVYQAPDPVFDRATDKFYTATTAGHIISVNRSDGAIDSHLFAFGVPATTKVAIFEDILVMGVDSPASGSMVLGLDKLGLNKADKSIIWTFPVDSRVNKEIVVDAEGNLYFTTFNYATKSSKVYSLDKDGKERWILDLGAPTELYPVLGENAVFIGVGGANGGKLLKIADY